MIETKPEGSAPTRLPEETSKKTPPTSETGHDPESCGVRLARARRLLGRPSTLVVFASGILGMLTGIVTLFAIIAGIQGFRSLRFDDEARGSFQKVVDRETTRVREQIQKISAEYLVGYPLEQWKKYAPSADRDEAIWRLDKILKDKQNVPSDLPDIVNEFRSVHRLLRLAPDSFCASYRGEVWIAVKLLQSGNVAVAESVKKVVPTRDSLRMMLEDNLANPNEKDSADLRKAIGTLIDVATHSR